MLHVEHGHVLVHAGLLPLAPDGCALLEHPRISRSDRALDVVGVKYTTALGVAASAMTHVDDVLGTRAGAVLCTVELAKAVAESLPPVVLLCVEHPRLEFSRIGTELEVKTESSVVHETANISDKAHIGSRLTAGPGVVVEDNAVIGDDCVLGSGAVVGASVRIGDRVTLGAHANLGAPGFGFERDKSGRLIRFPQLGRVLVEDDVEIGVNVCINRGALSDTHVSAGTKLDDLSYVAHNVVIGRDCLIMAGVLILGSARIGNRVNLSPGAVIREHCAVGDDAHVGLGAVVVSDVAAGSTVAGVPARDFHRRSE